MPQVNEKPKQFVKVHHSDPASTREYAISLASTRDIALAAIQAVAPAIDTIGGVSRFLESIEVKEFGGGCWDATAKYVKNPNRVEMNFDIGTGSIKAMQSIATVRTYPEEVTLDFPYEPPNFDKGISYNGTHFDGADREISKLEFSLNKKLQMSILPATYLVDVFDLAQKTNAEEFSFTWKGQELWFPAGTLRFRGAQIKIDSDEALDLTYKFLYEKNVTVEDDITVGGIGPIEKGGHELLWVYYDDATSNGRKIKRAVAIYIEQMYYSGDFNILIL